MKGTPEQLRQLLEETLPPAPGPTRAAILDMVRRRRRRRQLARTAGTLAAAAAAVLVLLATAFQWRPWQPVSETAPQRSVANSPPPAQTAPKNNPVVVEEIDDAELLTLLKGTPAALMEWPNGDRTLLIVQQ